MVVACFVGGGGGVGCDCDPFCQPYTGSNGAPKLLNLNDMFIIRSEGRNRFHIDSHVNGFHFKRLYS